MENVGHRLEALRSRLTLSWAELADRIGISRSMLDFVRAGDRDPSPKTLRKIAAVEVDAGLRSPTMILNEEPSRYGEDLPPPSGKDPAVADEVVFAELRRLRSQVESMRTLLDAVAADVIRMKKPKE